MESFQSLLHLAELLVHLVSPVMRLLFVNFVRQFGLECLHQRLAAHLLALRCPSFCMLLDSLIQTHVLAILGAPGLLAASAISRSLILLDLQLLHHLQER